MASKEVSQPQMAKLYFMSDGKEPVKQWEECKKAQKDWEKWSKENKAEDEQLQDAIKNLVITSFSCRTNLKILYLKEQMKRK